MRTESCRQVMKFIFKSSLHTKSYGVNAPKKYFTP